MGETSIEWTDFSINPIRGRLRSDRRKVGHYCEKISPGCARCYSSRLQPRFGTPEFGGASGREEVEPYLDESKLREVMARKKPTRYFWCSMSDLFGDWVNDEWISRCFAAMALTPHHTHQVLTKRPERMATFMNAPHRGWTVAQWMAGGAMMPAEYRDHRPEWPPPNVWLGTSVEDQQRADERVPHLLKCPAAVRFLSCEPLLGRLDLRNPFYGLFPERSPSLDTYDMPGGEPDGPGPDRSRGLHWVIVGGESGPSARPMHPDWARGLRDQCVSAGVSFFHKQNGEFEEYDNRTHGMTKSAGDARVNGLPLVMVDDGVPVTTRLTPEGIARTGQAVTPMVRVGKKAAGRLLDGRTWDEVPAAKGGGG